MNIFSCYIRRNVLLLLALLGVPMATLRAQEEKADGTNRVIVSKQDMRITVLCPRGDTLAVFPIACGRNYGDKQQEWDFRTPEGHFVIESVEDTSLWPRDSTRKETPGEIYGPRFFRLKTPGFTGIGIHLSLIHI